MLCGCFAASRIQLPERRDISESRKPVSRVVARSRSFSPEPPILVTASSRSRQFLEEKALRDGEALHSNDQTPCLSTISCLRQKALEQDIWHQEDLDDGLDEITSTHASIEGDGPSISSTSSLTSSLSDEKHLQAPVFLGKWKFSKFEGNFEAMMIDAGVSWTTRKMAKSANYGIGLATHDIQQRGNELSINVHNGLLGTTMKLTVNGREQESIHEDGTRVLITPSWEGQMLRVEGKTKQGHRKIQSTKRYLSGEQMVIETTTSSGEVVLRYFSRVR